MADDNYTRPEDHNKRMKAAARYANWHLGSNWAAPILEVYEDPERAEKELDEEQGVKDTNA